MVKHPQLCAVRKHEPVSNCRELRTVPGTESCGPGQQQQDTQKSLTFLMSATVADCVKLSGGEGRELPMSGSQLHS